MKHVNLEVYRVVYVLFVLVVAPRGLNPALGELPPQMFSAPWGAHLVLQTPPSAALILTAGFIRWAALVLLLFKVLPRAASLVAFIAWLWLGGVESGFGKIDHELIMAAPLLAFGLSGWSEPNPRGVYVVAALIASFFFTAGLIKLCSGWLNFQASAVSGVLRYYDSVYGHPSAQLSQWPFALFKALDLATVALECSFVVVLFRPKWLPFWLLAAWGFHEGVDWALGINFKKLSVLYLLFLPLDAARAAPWVRRAQALAVPRVARWLIAGALVVGTGVRLQRAPTPDTFSWLVEATRGPWDVLFPAWLLFFVAREAARLLRRSSPRRRAQCAGDRARG